jgi:hypothetical protein
MYFANMNSVQRYNKTAATEMIMVFNTVKHFLSYASTDFTNVLLSHVSDDSNIANKISCGITKGESVVTNILAPKISRML